MKRAPVPKWHAAQLKVCALANATPVHSCRVNREEESRMPALSDGRTKGTYVWRRTAVSLRPSEQKLPGYPAWLLGMNVSKTAHFGTGVSEWNCLWLGVNSRPAQVLQNLSHACRPAGHKTVSRLLAAMTD